MNREREIEARVNDELSGEYEVYVGRYGDHGFHVVTDNGRYKDIAATFEFSRAIEGDEQRVEKLANAWAQAPADIRYLLARVRELESALFDCQRDMVEVVNDLRKDMADRDHKHQRELATVHRDYERKLADAAASGDAETEAT